MKAAIILVLMSLLLGCSSVNKAQLETGYKTTKDDFIGFERHSNASTSYLDGMGLTYNYVYFELYADKQKDNNYNMALAIILKLQNWIFVEPGETLFVKTDSGIIKFRSPTGSRGLRNVSRGMDAIGGNSIREEVHYPITVSQIKQLAESSSLEIKVYGSKGALTRTFNKDHLASIRAYYDKFIVAHGFHDLAP